jgi:hypothetical protein
MNADNWIVNDGTGKEWGVIKRLLLDSATRQINFADVVVIHTGHVARIAWHRFHIDQAGITLGMAEVQGSTLNSRVPETLNGEMLSINVWP